MFVSLEQLLFVLCHSEKKKRMESGDTEGTSWVNLICSSRYHVNLTYVFCYQKLLFAATCFFPRLGRVMVHHPKFILALSSPRKDSPYLICCYLKVKHLVEINQPFSVNNHSRERAAYLPSTSIGTDRERFIHCKTHRRIHLPNTSSFLWLSWEK